MALDEYKRKRDFTKTPEPEPKVGAKRAERFFCVQKHLASHLHYDFRLEHEGVLLSWAVPKGPSLDPSVKRLAMHVEDHPVDYGEFEGVIPSGYGAGIVMLWDRGTWEPEVDDVAAALKKGDLKLRLNGVKLKGSWVLVRTGGRYAGGSGQRSWLLIKHRDDWSGELDITEFAPLSVKSGGDFPDILAADNPDVWVSHKPAAGGAAGEMLTEIIEKAAALKAGRALPARVTRQESIKKPDSPSAKRSTKASSRQTRTVAAKASPAAKAPRATAAAKKSASFGARPKPRSR